MIEVIISPKMHFEKAVRTFKKLCNKEGVFLECERRRYYMKPSDQKRGKAMLKRAFNK